jgi:hypothetical protein
MPEPRRGRPALKYNQELADQFGIVPGAPEQRETVKVDHIPDPPGTYAPPLQENQAAQRNQIQGRVTEDDIVNAVREEMDELAARLERFGLNFSVPCRQQMVDTAMVLLSGMGGGGAVPGR